MLKINDKIPNFEILTDQGKFEISNYTGKKIVIFFFPKADTSGCTMESIAFTNLQKEFDQLKRNGMIPKGVGYVKFREMIRLSYPPKRKK